MSGVTFVRLIASSDDITKTLTSCYAEGWRVVSHAEYDGEYSFVLEREESDGAIAFDETLACKLDLVVEVLLSTGACNAATTVREAITALRGVALVGV
jgi:aminopeptidase-like protein